MSKLVQAFLTGAFFTFILDFFLFLGIKQNYTDFYKIDLYYNILFADNQNIFIYLIFSVLIGYLVIYLNNNKLTGIVLGILFFIVSLVMIPSIGHLVGESLFMKKNVTYKNAKHTFKGNVYYEGRTQITFFDNELQKIITLNKKDLIK